MHADLQLGPGYTILLDVCTFRGRLLSFANPGTVLVNNGPLTVLGSDNDGWIRLQASGQLASWQHQPICHTAGRYGIIFDQLVDVSCHAALVQINLQSLTADITSAASVVGGTKTGTGTWNRLVFKDISGAYTAVQTSGLRITLMACYSICMPLLLCLCSSVPTVPGVLCLNCLEC
jgi:hypothetical protein